MAHQSDPYHYPYLAQGRPSTSRASRSSGSEDASRRTMSEPQPGHEYQSPEITPSLEYVTRQLVPWGGNDEAPFMSHDWRSMYLSMHDPDLGKPNNEQMRDLMASFGHRAPAFGSVPETPEEHLDNLWAGSDEKNYPQVKTLVGEYTEKCKIDVSQVQSHWNETKTRIQEELSKIDALLEALQKEVSENKALMDRTFEVIQRMNQLADQVRATQDPALKTTLLSEKAGFETELEQIESRMGAKEEPKVLEKAMDRLNDRRSKLRKALVLRTGWVYVKTNRRDREDAKMVEQYSQKYLQTPSL